MKVTTYSTTKDLILNIPVPEQTRTYKPVSNLELIDTTLDSIVKAGFSVEKEIYNSAREGNVSTGRYLLNATDSEMQIQVMWQNSYDKTRSLTFSVGAHVLVCQNGMMAFRGMNSFKKKHSGEIQEITPQNISEFIKHSGELFQTLQGERERMKQLPVSRRIVSEILGRMYFEEQFLESTQLNIIKRELEHPTHNYNAAGSLWELYQFTTFAIGGIHPSRWLDDHIDAHNFFSTLVDEYEANAVSPVAEKVSDIQDVYQQLSWLDQIK